MKDPRTVEEILADALKERYGTDFEREFRFHPTRKWRYDLACKTLRICIDIQGYRSHSSAKAIRNDCEKHNAATEQGYKVLIYPAASVLAKCRRERIVEQIGRIAGGLTDDGLSGCVLNGD